MKRSKRKNNKERINIRKFIKSRIINGTKGVISLFLAILMVPFTAIAASLVNAGRVNSSVAIFDESMSNAANSTLATYEKFIKDRFGLLAISQNGSEADTLSSGTVNTYIGDTYKSYLNENLKALSNTYLSSDSECVGAFPLSDENVMLSQILEYSKYSVPTKVIEDGLYLDDIVKSLESLLPFSGFLDVITAGNGLADAFITLGNDFDLLKDAISEEDTALEIYNKKYNEFKENANKYISKSQEMVSTLNNLQNDIDDESEKLGDIGEKINALNEEIEKLRKEQEENKKVDNSKKIEEKEKELKKITEDNEDAVERLNNAQNEYNTKKADYESQVSSYKTKTETAKSEYSSAISDLSGKMNTVKSKLTTVQGDITKVESASVGMVNAIGTEGLNHVKNNNDKQIEKLKEDLKTAETDEQKQIINDNITKLKDANTGTKNTQTVSKAIEKGFSSAMSEIKTNIKEYNYTFYDSARGELEKLKGRVDAYSLTSGETVTDSKYYVSTSGRLTKKAAEDAEKAFMKEMASNAIWSIIKALYGFIESLFSVTTVYDSKLGAVINNNFYKTNYGGLPSEKDRNKYPLYFGEASDELMSKEYKELYGDYSAADIKALGGFDLFTALSNIGNSLKKINDDVCMIVATLGIAGFAGLFKDIANQISNIVNNFKQIIDAVGNMLTSSNIYRKLLVTGYMSYMVPDRTTYTGTALNGKPFSQSEKETDKTYGFGQIQDIIGLVQTIFKAVNGGEDLSFVGAEKEYLIYGSSSELVNQAAAFAANYIIRLIADLPTLLIDTQISEIAAASTIAAPLVYLLYALLEPLCDTVLLVNGSKVPLIKTTAYLTPKGLKELIKGFTSLSLNTAQMKDSKTELLDSLGVSDKDGFDLETDTKSSLITITYSKNLFLIMAIFTSQDNLIKRFSNIVEMETNEYLSHNSGGLFDLDYSYTYLRAKASFTTNEFISLSGKAGIKPRERIIYRGY